MPDFSKYPSESSADFAQRMKRRGKGGITKAASRFLETAQQRDQRKGINRNY